MKNTSKKSALIQTAEEYASRSSIHGIGYVFDRDLNFVDRLLWLFLVIAFAAVAAALTWNFWTQWREEQVIQTKDLLGASNYSFIYKNQDGRTFVRQTCYPVDKNP